VIRLSHTAKELSTEYKSLDILGEDKESFRYGYMWRNGALKFAPSIGELYYSFDGKALAYKKYIPECGRLFYSLSNGISYALDIATSERMLFGALNSGGLYSFVTYDSEGAVCYCMGSKNKYYTVGDSFSGKQSVSVSHNVSGGIIHCFRLFCIDMDDPLILRWTGPESVDWTEGVYGSGYLRLNAEGGKILSLAEYGDGVLILREGGITVLRALGDPRSYRISPSQLLIPVQNIVCGGGVYNDKYYFLCSDGVYSFDGDEVERVFKYPYEGEITYTALDVPSDGRIYVGCTLGEDKYMIAYNPTDKSFTLFGKGCSDAVYAGGMYVVYDCGLYPLSSAYRDEASLWRSKKFNLGTGAKKTLKRIHVTASDTTVTTVYADGMARSFTGGGTFYVGERASEFYFELSSGEDISALSADFEVTK